MTINKILYNINLNFQMTIRLQAIPEKAWTKNFNAE